MSYSEMDLKRKGLIIAYYFSRCDIKACSQLGYSSFADAFSSIGLIIGEKPSNIKNMRDEFDPFFANKRRGWYQRPLAPSRKEIFDEFESCSDEELLSIVKQVLGRTDTAANTSYECVIKNLGALIRQTSARYKSEFVWQDVELTDDFKREYGEHLKKNNYSIDFFTNTAVITSSSTKNIFLPNQWFVISSYAVGVYLELMKYKNLFLRVTEARGVKPDDYAKSLKTDASESDKVLFFDSCDKAFSKQVNQDGQNLIMHRRLWRFATDYSWWSGQKTIDRGDFHYSVILNLLNLVNASQSYVAEIVNAYGSNPVLLEMTKNLESFTKDMRGITYDFDLEKESEPVSHPSDAALSGQKAIEAGKHKIVISQSSLSRLDKKEK